MTSPTDFYALQTGPNSTGTGAHNLTASGAGVTYGPGYAALNGTDYLASATNLFTPAGDFTLTCFVYFNATGLATICGNYGGFGGWRVTTRTTQVEFQGYNGSGFQLAAKSYTQAATTFYFVACKYVSATKVMSVDINNSGTWATVTLSAALTNTTPASDGLRVGNSIAGFGNLAGRVKYLGYWDGTILSAGDLTTLYNGGAGFDPTAGGAKPRTGLFGGMSVLNGGLA